MMGSDKKVFNVMLYSHDTRCELVDTGKMTYIFV